MGLDRTAIKALADAALTAIVDYWPNDAPALPARRNVANGEVFWDCEQVAVAVERVFGAEGDPTFETMNASALAGFRGLTLAVWILRCVPDVDGNGDEVIVPSAADIDASAAVLLGDAVTVWELLRDAQQGGKLATCQGLAFQDWTPAGPFGGFGGSVTRVRMQLL